MTNLLYKTQTHWLFHSHIKLKFSAFYDDRLFDELYAILENVDKLYNSYSSQSYIHQINENAGEFVEVDGETINILTQIIKLSDLFDGEFDITIMPLIRLWGFYKDKGKVIPTKEKIEEAKTKVDYKQIEISGNKVRIKEGQEIITGSFIKAYAVDRMINRMTETGISDAIVNAGGSTIKGIINESHPFWSVLVKNQETQQELFTLKLSDKCFSTSAQNKTFVEIDGEKYGHIISPKSGYPSTNRQIGIISDDCFTGDVVSTGLFNYSGEDFLEKMKVLSEDFNIEGFLIDKNDNIFFSDKFKQYIIE